MKKFRLLLSLSILFFALYSCEQQDEINSLESIDSKSKITKDYIPLANDDDIVYCGEDDYPKEYTFWAGQNIDAGTVTVGNDDEYLYVTVYSKEGYQDVEDNLKMWVGTELSDIPSNGPGIPNPGHFPYKATVTGNTHTFKILLTDIDYWSESEDDCNQNLYIAVHGDVVAKDEDGNLGDQTAWGGDIPGEGPRWWYYIAYMTACCDEEPPVVDLMDAFAYKNPHSNTDWSTCFLDDGFDNWGWTIGRFSYGVREWNIDLKIDGQSGDTCKNPENTIKIGSVKFWIENEWVDGSQTNEVHFEIVIEDPNYKMNKSQIYIGENKYPQDGGGNDTIDPMFYGNGHDDLDGATSDTYVIGGVPANFYVIIHADIVNEIPLVD